MQITHQTQGIARPQHSGARHGRFSVVLNLALCGALLATSVSGMAENKTSEAQAAYQRERANCLNGHTNESRATCLREASAALEATKRGQLNDTNTHYQQNATLRCQAFHTQENRDACEQRVNDGTVEGSVGSGGIIRELTVRTPVPQEDNPAQDHAQ